MNNTKIKGGLNAAEAAAKAGVSTWKVLRLASAKIIFSRCDKDGTVYVSPAAIPDLPRLCALHFSKAGEFLANPPTIITGHGMSFDGLTTQNFMEIN
jgi:hypothetical protein